MFGKPYLTMHKIYNNHRAVYISYSDCCKQVGTFVSHLLYDHSNCHRRVTSVLPSSDQTVDRMAIHKVMIHLIIDCFGQTGG